MNREKRVLEKNSHNVFPLNYSRQHLGMDGTKMAKIMLKIAEEMLANGFNLFLDRKTRCLDLIASRYRHFYRDRCR